MYEYDAVDTAQVKARVAEFRDQVARRIAGELTEDQFKPLRLMNGLYLQLHAYMLRAAIPYGTLSSRQLRALASVARRWDRGYGHVTTRQNMQFNWVRLIDVPDILDHLADHGMHAIQTSGNCIRNVTADAFAGAAADEITDARVWCEIIRQWSTFHPEFSFLPRKFKIAVNAAREDRVATQVHDIGLDLISDADGALGFRVLVGGGLGRTPTIGEEVRAFVPEAQILSYLEAILRVYNVHGRRDNIYKARIKILVQELGIDAFRAAVDDVFASLTANGRAAQVDLPHEEYIRIAAHFAPPALTADRAGEDTLAAAMAADPALARFVARNTRLHRVEGYRSVTVSLKASGQPPGDITADQMERLADLAEHWGADEIRTTIEQNIVLPHIAAANVPELYRALIDIGLGTDNIGEITDIVACPGLDYCNLANTRSIPIANRLQERFDDARRRAEIGPLNIKISGCINACGHHHVGHIGILGVDKQGEEYYQITLGGAADRAAAIGEIVGRGLATGEVVDAVDRMVAHYLGIRSSKDEHFIDVVRRVGVEPFREAIHAHLSS